MREAGFTLIELIITVFILSVLLAVAMPSFLDTVRSNQISAQANDFVGALSLARSEAVKRGRNITITATSSTSSNEFGGGWSIFVDSDNDGVVDSGEEIIRVHEALQGSNTLNSVNNISTLAFTATGFLSTTNTLTFRLCETRAGKIGREITIKATGRVSSAQYTCP